MLAYEPAHFVVLLIRLYMTLLYPSFLSHFSSKRAFILAALLVTFLSAAAKAQDPVVLTRLEGTIELDGFVNESEWEDIEPLELTMYEPLYKGDLSEHSEIRIAYDDYYLYLSGRFFDADPDGIRANSLYRDRYSGDDTFAIILDTFNDNENARWFFTTPNGVRIDMAVSKDGEGGPGGGGGGSSGNSIQFGGAVNDSWNTFWDVATQRNEEGWFAEMRIPYSSLGFQNINGRVVMGLIAYRYIARKNERQIYPAIPPNWRMGFIKPSQAQDVALEDVQSQKPLYVTPYAIGGLGQVSALNDSESAYSFQNDKTRELGLDLKYNLTSNLTVDLTLNTDFAQVEADDQMVNLTRFSLFFPEKRQFFQERSDIFDVSTGRRDRLFYSRRIGIDNDGNTVPIIGGSRLVGRIGLWDVGVLDMQTARSKTLPSENFGVFRIRRQVFNENSYVGGMATSRIGDDGSYNTTYGLDGIVRISEREYLTVQWAQSVDDELIKANQFDFVESGLIRLQLERRGQQGFGGSLSVTRSGVDYNPGVGFVTRTDFTSPFARFSYGWFPGESSQLRRISPDVFFSTYFRNEDGSLESVFAGHGWNLDFKNGDTFSADFRFQVDDLLEPLSFPEDTEIPEGRYTYYTAESRYRMNMGSLLRTSANAEAGAFYDGWRVQLALFPTWNVSRFLELGGEYEFNRVRFPDRDQGFDAHVIRLRTQIGLNTKVSTNAFIQFNSTDDFVSANIRFRYNFREGNDLWIVYNEGLNSDRYRVSPRLPRTDNRALLIKFTYTFRS